MAMSPNHSVTIKDVAIHASVSVATVSAVINKNKYVSPELARRVHESITALSFQRNSFARGLKTRVSYSIGLIVPDITNPFFTNIARGVEDVASAHNYSLILGNTDEDPEKEKKYLQLLESKQADGLIIAVTARSHEYLQSLPIQHLALVSIDRSLFDLGIDTVMVDNRAGARKAIEHLIALGHRRIGLVTGIRGIAPTEERLLGYTEALEKHGIAVDPAGCSRACEARRPQPVPAAGAGGKGSAGIAAGAGRIQLCRPAPACQWMAGICARRFECDRVEAALRFLGARTIDAWRAAGP